jgi:hypothetical protein
VSYRASFVCSTDLALNFGTHPHETQRRGTPYSILSTCLTPPYLCFDMLSLHQASALLKLQKGNSKSVDFRQISISLYSQPTFRADYGYQQACTHKLPPHMIVAPFHSILGKLGSTQVQFNHHPAFKGGALVTAPQRQHSHNQTYYTCA